MKKGMTFFWGVALFATALLTSCGDNTSSEAVETKQTEAVAKPEATTASTSELLQGEWQSVDDASNYLVFEGEHRKEIADGMDDWDDEIFVLSDRCANPSDKENGLDREADKYISCAKSDLCWYIIDVDAENLSLSYMGRGNTLTYKRVK